MTLNLPIHHIGVATWSLQEELFYFRALGFVCEDTFEDESVGVRGIFLIPKDEKHPLYRLEILENLTPKGPLTSYLKNRTKMYHLAYETQNIESSIKELFEALDSCAKKSSADFEAVCGFEKSVESKIESVVDSTHSTTSAGGGKAMVIIQPKEARYFRKIAFVMLRNSLLVEFVEK